MGGEVLKFINVYVVTNFQLWVYICKEMSVIISLIEKSLLFECWKLVK